MKYTFRMGGVAGDWPEVIREGDVTILVARFYGPDAAELGRMFADFLNIGRGVSK